MNRATTATSMPIKNRPALTPSITPKRGSTVIHMETTSQVGTLVLTKQGDGSTTSPGSLLKKNSNDAHTEAVPI